MTQHATSLSPVASGVVSGVASVYALGYDTAGPESAGQRACEPPACEGDCISVQQRIPIYQQPAPGQLHSASPADR